MASRYAARIAALHRTLRIPAGYATERGLTLQREAAVLRSIGRAADDGRPLRLAPRPAAAWKRMHTAAARDGVTLLPLSAFRSVARQATIVRRKLARRDNISDILRLVAAPGYSEHHTGRALDLGTRGHCDLRASFSRTRAFRWLKSHAAKFGFHLSYPRNNPYGIAYEPWHWFWRE